MTKKQVYSITSVKRSLDSIENDIALELKRYSKERHKRINKAFASICLHMARLDVETASLSHLRGFYYDPEKNREYFEGLRRIVETIDVFMKHKQEVMKDEDS